MSEHSDLYRAFSHLGFPDHAWKGNLVKGKGRWYLSDGHTLFRVSACDPEKLAARNLERPHGYRTPDQYASEAKAKGVVETALEKATHKVGPEPDAWGLGHPVRDCVRWGVGRPRIAFDAHKIRLATYVTNADRLLVPAPDARDRRQTPFPSVLSRGSEWVAVLMPLADRGIEWEDRTEALEAAS